MMLRCLGDQEILNDLQQPPFPFFFRRRKDLIHNICRSVLRHQGRLGSEQESEALQHPPTQHRLIVLVVERQHGTVDVLRNRAKGDGIDVLGKWRLISTEVVKVAIFSK